jgi:hypothetical protein
MNRAQRAGAVIAVSVAIMTLTTAGPAVAVTSAVGPPRWAIMATVHYGSAANASGYSAVIAPSKADAWVFGGTNPGGTSAPAAEHWNGARWSPSRLPSGLGGFIVASSASSASNIWAVGSGYALRWNGVRWAVANTWPQRGELTSVAAISPADVWVFGGSAFTSGTSPGAWHYNGHQWLKVAGIASGIYRSSAVSRHDIWAVTAGSVVHYGGHAWRTVRAAAVALGRTQLDDVLAESARSVWVSGISPTTWANGHLVLARWNGRRWARFVAPWRVQQAERFAPDGAGGIWVPVVTGGITSQTWILHLSRAGRWARIPIAAGPDTGVGVSDLALIPGTRSLWGSGGLLTAFGGNATIWDHLVVPGRWTAETEGTATTDGAAWAHWTLKESMSALYGEHYHWAILQNGTVPAQDRWRPHRHHHHKAVADTD